MTEKDPMAVPLHAGSDCDLRVDAMEHIRHESAGLALQEFDHRAAQQRSVFSSALGLIAVLYVVAIVFATVGLFHMTGRLAADWHAAILGSTYVIPPTLLLMALIRAIYARQESGDRSDVPAAELAKEALGACRDLLRR